VSLKEKKENHLILSEERERDSWPQFNNKKKLILVIMGFTCQE
jgi:hypothetical protein